MTELLVKRTKNSNSQKNKKNPKSSIPGPSIAWKLCFAFTNALSPHCWANAGVRLVFVFPRPDCYSPETVVRGHGYMFMPFTVFGYKMNFLSS